MVWGGVVLPPVLPLVAQGRLEELDLFEVVLLCLLVQRSYYLELDSLVLVPVLALEPGGVSSRLHSCGVAQA